MTRKNICKHLALEWVTKRKGPLARALLSWGDLWPLTICGHNVLGCALWFEEVCPTEKRTCDNYLCLWRLPASFLDWNLPPVSQICVEVSHPSFLRFTAWENPRPQLPFVVTGLQGVEIVSSGRIPWGCRRVVCPTVSQGQRRSLCHLTGNRNRLGMKDLCRGSLVTVWDLLAPWALLGGWECWWPCSFVGCLGVLYLLEKIKLEFTLLPVLR